ncbi:MAG: NINE protein [Bacteroidia bacterium]|nr:NINE protein [Bacteroidia bacterium]
MKDKGTATALALLLGGIGIHRFYVGQNWLGLAYLLFCWTYLPLIFGVFDCIVWAVMSKEDFNAKFNPPQEPKFVITRHLSIADEIEKLHRLKESGLITETEYEKKKSELLN